MPDRPAVPAPGADPVYGGRGDRLRIFLNNQGASVQWWDFWPRYVVTLWWWPLRLRVYFWRGRRRAS